MSSYLIIIALYFLLMLILGFLSYKKEEGFAYYILGNRSLSAFVIGVSYLSSEISVGTFTVAASMIYKTGLTRIWIDFSFLICTILCWQLIARRLRFYSEKLGDALTIPQYLTNRFESNIIGILATLIIVFFTSIYIAANLLGFAKIAGYIFELPPFLSYGLSFLIIIIYVVAGGFKATCFTDVAQGIIMLLAPLILAISLTFKLGASSLHTALIIRASIGNMPIINSLSNDLTQVIFYLGFGMCLFGAPHTITRFMAIRSVGDIKHARNISIILNIIMYISIAVSALYSIVVFDSVKDPEVILFQLSKLFLHPLLGGLIVAATIAAMMSTVDSQLMLCSSCLTNDIYKKFKKKPVSDNKLINITRVFTVMISLLALIIGAFYGQSVLRLAIFALTGLGTSLGPILIISLYNKKVSSRAAILGISTGALLTFLSLSWNHVIDPHYNLLPIFLISGIVIIGFSFYEQRNNIYYKNYDQNKEGDSYSFKLIKLENKIQKIYADFKQL